MSGPACPFTESAHSPSAQCVIFLHGKRVGSHYPCLYAGCVRCHSRWVLVVLALVAVFLSACGGTTAPASSASRSDTGSGSGSGTVAFVANFAYADQPGTTITEVSLGKRRVERSITLGRLPSAFAATARGTKLLVADEGSDRLSILSVTAAKVVAVVRVGLEPDAIAVTPNGATALVADFGANTVTPVALTTMKALPPTYVGVDPTGVASAPGGSVAWVSGGSSIVPLSLATLHAGTALGAGGIAEAIAIGPAPGAGDGNGGGTGGTGSNGGTAAWVALQDGWVNAVDLASGAIEARVYVGGRPSAIAIPASTG